MQAAQKPARIALMTMSLTRQPRHPAPLAQPAAALEVHTHAVRWRRRRVCYAIAAEFKRRNTAGPGVPASTSARSTQPRMVSDFTSINAPT